MNLLKALVWQKLSARRPLQQLILQGMTATLQLRQESSTTGIWKNQTQCGHGNGATIHSTGILLFFFGIWALLQSSIQSSWKRSALCDRIRPKHRKEFRFLVFGGVSQYFYNSEKVLYDCRASTPIKKVTLQMQSNGVSWNPQEAMIFTVANEDNNLYSFDLRNVGFKHLYFF